MLRNRLTLLVVLGAAVASARADDVICLEGGGFIERLDTADGALTGRQSIKGIREAVPEGIDTRPSTGVLYGVTRRQLYTIDAESGWATKAGNEFGSLQWNWTGVRMGFDPKGDVAYVVVNGPNVGSNVWPNDLMRIEPDTGAAIGRPSGQDRVALEYAAGDPGEGSPLRNISIAHDVNPPGGPEGSIFGVDVARGTLFRVGWPSGVAFAGSPTATTVGPLGLKLSSPIFERVPLKIQRDGTALLTSRHSHDSTTSLGIYRVDLATGAATLIADAENRAVADIAATPTVPTQSVRELTVSRVLLRIRFAKHGNRALFEVHGQLPAPASADGWNGKQVRVCISDAADVAHQVNEDHVLDARGRGRMNMRSFAIGRERSGVVPFVLRYERPSAPRFSITAKTPSQPIQMKLDLLVDGHPFGTTVDLDYVRGRTSGVATNAK